VGVDRARDNLVGPSRLVLVDDRSSLAVVTHPGHQIPEAGTAGRREVVPGVPEIVKVQAFGAEPEMFGRYGVRVPVIVVSPWIESRTVSHTLFDHTTIIKTILSRFCPQALHQPQHSERKRPRPGLSPHYPGLRVARASHLGELLTRDAPRPAPPREALVRQAAARAAKSEASPPRPGGHEEGDHPLNDLQKSILAATAKLRSDGHPADAP
jgi:phospholipase C